MSLILFFIDIIFHQDVPVINEANSTIRQYLQTHFLSHNETRFYLYTNRVITCVSEYFAVF